MKYLMLLSIFFALNLKAESEMYINDDLTLADEAIESPSMEIEEMYKIAEPIQAPAPALETESDIASNEVVRRAPKRPKQVSATDRLKRTRQRLEEKNHIMIEKRMEQVRYQQEIALAKKLEASMNQTIKAIGNIK